MQRANTLISYAVRGNQREVSVYLNGPHSREAIKEVVKALKRQGYRVDWYYNRNLRQINIWW